MSWRWRIEPISTVHVGRSFPRHLPVGRPPGRRAVRHRRARPRRAPSRLAVAFPHGMDGPGATRGGGGMAVHIPTVAVPYQAPEGQGRSRHGRTLWNGTAVRAAVVQPRRGQRHTEPLPAHMDAVIPCTCTPMSMCTRGTPPTPADQRSRSQAHGGMLLAHADRAGPAFGLGLPGTDHDGRPSIGWRAECRSGVRGHPPARG